ncbi:helix-turn-helix domain-containing protein [Paracoccus sp. P2]|uniref:helix-turn-helix domain-containing protein n=1 Tax=Paracoccus sp. P2 TaxID=3248840 RepID=UPI00391F22C0
MSRSRLNIRTIGQVVADYYGVDWIDITSARRSQHIVRPRQVTMWAARGHTNLSLPQIGRRCGGRDHTTVLHACRKIDHLRETDSEVARELRDIEGLLAEREAMLAQHLIVPEPDLDPFEIAERIISTPATEWGLTLPEMHALAQAVILRRPPAEEDAPAPAQAARPEPDPASSVPARRPSARPAMPPPVADVLKAFRALENARFSARERAERAAFERTLNSLSTHFKTESRHAGH